LLHGEGAHDYERAAQNKTTLVPDRQGVRLSLNNLLQITIDVVADSSHVGGAYKECAMKNIVVGVDGSQGSIEALRWAVAEANLHGAKLRAITAWEFPYLYPEGAALLPLDQYESETRARLDKIINDTVADPATRAQIERTTISGNPSSILEIESKTCDLVVVGARGHGGFVGLLLGSVSDQIVKHAHCPVVVVRTEKSK
jgi:nucleotide-binding universal stress UspA family protein